METQVGNSFAQIGVDDAGFDGSPPIDPIDFEDPTHSREMENNSPVGRIRSAADAGSRSSSKVGDVFFAAKLDDFGNLARTLGKHHGGGEVLLHREAVALVDEELLRFVKKAFLSDDLGELGKKGCFESLLGHDRASRKLRQVDRYCVLFDRCFRAICFSSGVSCRFEAAQYIRKLPPVCSLPNGEFHPSVWQLFVMGTGSLAMT